MSLQAAPSPAGPKASLVRETTNATFRADVLSDSARQPVLVEFWAPSIPQSRAMQPMLEKLVNAAAGKFKLVRMNVEAHPQIAQQLGIQSLPCVYAFQRGQPVDGFMGALPEAQVRGFIERLIGPLGSELADVLAEADALASEGDGQAASEIYSGILAQEPGNADARAGLARQLLATGDLESTKALLAQAPGEVRKHAAIIAVQAALEIAGQAASVGDTGDLLRQIKENPRNFKARLELALALNAGGKREEAADALLEIIRSDRKWEEDGARKQLIQFFESWGPMDSATQQARRKLSAVLFA